MKELVEKLSTMPVDQLPDALIEFSKVWGRPRGDLCLWISVLNRHDNILKEMTEKYEMQPNIPRAVTFDPADEKLISAILTFTTFILSNSSNRGIFSSETYIYSFLYCLNPSLVSGALKVCVTLAIHHVHVHQKLYRPFLAPPEISQILKFCTFLTGASENPLLEYLHNKNPPSGFSIQYYMRGSGVPGGQSPFLSPSTQTVEGTPTKAHASPSALVNRSKNTPTKEGLTEFIISAKDAIEQPIDAMLKKIFAVVPPEYWQEAVIKTFIAKSTASTEEGFKMRQLLVEMQCDALAVAGYSFSSSLVENKIFQEHPHLIRHLCQLILPENFITEEIRIAGIDTFCALTCQATLVADIVITLSSHVNHGPLMIVVRHLVKDLKRKHEVNQDFMDGVTSLVLQLSNLAQSGSMMTTTSDMLPLLIELIRVGTAVPRARTNALDAMMHVLVDSPPSMSTFIQQHKGSDVALQFYEEAIESYLVAANRGAPPQYCNVDYSLSYYQSQWLKNIIHLIASIGANGRAQDRIHIILESKFIPLTTQLVLHPEIFGSRIIILALAIIGNTVEMESSALHVISEKDHLNLILKAVPNLLEHSPAFFTPIAKFYNSLFHHASGLELNKEFNLLENLFKYIRKHISGKDSLKNLGSTLDLIISEHPTMRSDIISESIKLIETMRSTLDQAPSEMGFFNEMEHVFQGESSEEDINAARTQALLNSAIGFIEGLLKNPMSQIEFINQKGLEAVLSYFDLECLNYDFTYSSPAMSLCLTVKHLFDLDCDRKYIGHAIISHLEKAITRVEDASAKIEANELDIIESTEYKHYLKQLGPLNNIMYAFYVTVFTNSGTGFRIVYILEELSSADIPSNLITRLGRIQRRAIWEDSRITQHISSAVRDATRAISLDAIFGSTYKRLQDTEDVKKLKELEAELNDEGKTPRFPIIKAGRFLLNGAIFSVSKLFYDISVYLGSSAYDLRHRIDDKSNYKLLESIAGVFLGHLNSFEIANASDVQMRFLVDALTCLQKVIYRPTSRILVLSRGVFIFFKQLGGVTRMVEILEHLFEHEACENDDSIIAGAIKVLLILTSYMVSSASVIESPASGARTWGHENPAFPNYFSQGQFFLECRITIFNTMIKLWKSRSLGKKPSSITNLVVSIMSSIFATAGDSLVPRLPLAVERASYICYQEARPAESLVNYLVNSGISRESAEHELRLDDDYKVAFETLGVKVPTNNMVWPLAPSSVPENENRPMNKLEDLTLMREQVLDDALDRAINLLREHPDNVFVISSFISKFIPSEANKSRTPVHGNNSVRLNTGVINEIMMAIRSMDPDEKSDEKVLAAYCHLLGFLLYDRTTLYSSLEDMIEYLATFVEFLERPDAINMEWFSHVLLILELVLTAKDIPDIPQSDDIGQRLKMNYEATVPKTGPIDPELIDRIFKALITIEEFTTDITALAVSRLFVYFTRDFHRAEFLRSSPSLLRLVRSVQAFAVNNTNDGTVFNQLRTTIIIILRHTVESAGIVREIMKSAIISHFENHETVYPENLYNVLAHYSHLLARAPDIFVEVVAELCTLSDPGNPRSSNICLKTAYEKRSASTIEKYNKLIGKNNEEEKEDVEMEDASAHDTSQLISTPSKPKGEIVDFLTPGNSKITHENSGVVHMLISELIGLKREDIFTVPGKTEEGLRQYIQENAAKKDDKKSGEKSEVKKPTSSPTYFYACFLIQSLSEMVASYSSCKLDFISFSRKSSLFSASTNFKPRAAALGYFLNELLPVGVIGTSDSLPSSEWSEISSLASSTVINLATTSDEQLKPKGNDDEIQNDPQLVMVRKFTIDSIARAFKEASRSSDSLDWRYSKLFALSELCYRMMSSRPTRPVKYSGWQVVAAPGDGAACAKIFYDRNFAALLTGTLSDIDLNYPDVRRPIRSLTKSLNKLSRLTMEVTDDVSAERQEEEDFDEQLGELSSDEDGYEEEAPDIFRNSTLGMFEAGEAMYDVDDVEIMEEETDSQIGEEDDEEGMDFDDDELSDVDSAMGNEVHEEIINISSDSGDMSDSDSADDDEDDDDEDDEMEDESEDGVSESIIFECFFTANLSG